MIATPSEQVRAARAWFALQGLAGVGWTIAVLTSTPVRDATLGALPPAAVLPPDVVLFSLGSLVTAASGSARWARVVLAWTVAVTAALTLYGLMTTRAGLGVAGMVIASSGTLLAALVLVHGRVTSSWALWGPLRFGAAGTASAGQHLRRSIRQLIVFWAFFLVLLPVLISAAERRLRLDVPALVSPGMRALGVLLLVLGSLLGWCSMWVMATRGLGTPLPSASAARMVQAGPYGVVRNPMAVAGALQAAGVGALLGSWATWIGVLVGALFWHVVIRPDEEADLAARFGREYERYRAQVPLWVPRPARADRRDVFTRRRP